LVQPFFRRGGGGGVFEIWGGSYLIFGKRWAGGDLGGKKNQRNDKTSKRFSKGDHFQRGLPGREGTLAVPRGKGRRFLVSSYRTKFKKKEVGGVKNQYRGGSFLKKNRKKKEVLRGKFLLGKSTGDSS